MNVLSFIDTYAAKATTKVAAASSNRWELGQFLKNAKDKIGEWGGAGLGIIGVAVIIYGGYLFAKAIFGQQEKGKTAITGAIALIVGGALSVGGFKLLRTMSGGGEQTISSLGSGSTGSIINIVTHATTGVVDIIPHMNTAVIHIVSNIQLF